MKFFAFFATGALSLEGAGAEKETDEEEVSELSTLVFTIKGRD